MYTTLLLLHFWVLWSRLNDSNKAYVNEEIKTKDESGAAPGMEIGTVQRSWRGRNIWVCGGIYKEDKSLP